MKKIMSMAVLGAAVATVATVACTSGQKESDRIPAGVTGPSLGGAGWTKNTYAHKANYYVRGAAGLVINFRKEAGEIDGRKQDVVLIETCELAAELSNCNPDPSKTIKISAAQFTQRIRMMLATGPFERITVAPGKTVSATDANLGKDPSLEVRSQIELDKIDQLQRTLARLEKSKLLDVATVDQKQIDDIKSKLSKIDKSSNENFRLRQAAKEVDKLVDDLVERVFDKNKTYELINGKDHDTIEWALFHAIMNPVELRTAFKTIPAGSYQVVKLRGPRDQRDQRSQRGRDEDDRKPSARTTEVRITKDFEIGLTEITQFDYVRIMGDNPSVAKTEKHCMKVEYYDGIPMCPNNPVDSVTKAQVDLFIKALNERDRDYKYSLPTEAQWEHAARFGGPGGAYAFGDLGTPQQGIGGLLGQFNITREDRIGASRFAWTADSWVGEEVDARESQEVANLRKNGVDYKNTSFHVGILARQKDQNPAAKEMIPDIHGNVAEWVLTSFGAKASQAGKEKKKLCSSGVDACYVDPCTGCGENDPLEIAKGGSFMMNLEQARIDASPKMSAGPDVGFRLIRTRK